MKTFLLRTLGRVGLLRPTYRGYERLRGLRSSADEVGDGPFPLPPATLRVRVAGNADPAWFLEGSRLAEDTLRGALERAGTRLEDMAAILDFGCGCGRVTRRLADLPGERHGSDFYGPAVEWCRDNLPFATFVHNGLQPPLPFGDGELELVYAFSVLTHLPVDLQQAWVGELARVLRPGGYLLLSTHGRSYLGRLNDDERALFQAGQVVVRFEEVAGTNLCTAFHPAAYVKTKLAAGLELVEEVPEGALGNPHQDLFLFRKPVGERSSLSATLTSP